MKIEIYKTRPHLVALDGLRGLAVLLVFLHHTLAFPKEFVFLRAVTEFGRLGVDLFFCLSGFLITGILLGAKEDEHYFRNFYARRALRIFPLYFLYLIVYAILVIQLQVVHFEKVSVAANDLKWAWFYGTNLLIAKQGVITTGSLSHFWTLAIEEHFYFLWPVLVYWLSSKKLLAAAGVITVGALALRISLQVHGTPELVIRTFTLCRIDTFAMGGVAAIFHRQKIRMPRQLLWPSLIVAAVLFYAWPWLFVSVGFTAMALFCTLTISWAASCSPSALSSEPLRFLGKYSYAIYLFHVPLQRFAFHHLQGVRNPFVAVAIDVTLVGTGSVAIAVISWSLIEKRALALKRFFPERTSLHEETSLINYAHPADVPAV